MTPDPHQSTVDSAEANKRVVLEHFEGIINRRDQGAIARTIAVGHYLDHDGPAGTAGSVEESIKRMDGMFTRFPDFRVELRDVVAEGDKVVVRGIWSGTDAQTAERMEFRAFVLLRLEEGKIVERWATATPLAPAQVGSPAW